MLDDRLEQLRTLGLQARAEAGDQSRGVRRGALYVAHDTSHRDYALHYGPNVPLSAVAAGTDARARFVLTTYVAPRTADAFRRAGIQFLDSVGNAWIAFGSVLIDIRGRPRPAASVRRSHPAGNLFSSGRAQVVFVLLTWPHLWDEPQRGIARAAGVSIGQVNSTLRLLKQSGYSGVAAHPGRADLLDLWASAFPTGLAHRITLAQYSSDGPIKPNTLISASVSGAAAVPDLIRSPMAVLYVDEFDPRMAVVNRWRSDREPNITLRRRFWTEPPPITDTDRTSAPWPLVYADLLASDDPRERIAAVEWRQRHV